MRILTISCVLAMILLGGNSVSSFADTFEVDIPDLVTIQNGNGEFRALLNFELPEGFGSFDIEMARLVIPFGPIDEEIEVQLFPVSTYWTPDYVNWDYPWNTPGGDYDDTLSVNMHMLKGDYLISEEVTFTVTEALMLIQHGVNYYGFILMPPPYEKVGFDDHLIFFFNEIDGIKMEIHTR